jgi:hypothetical protein
MTTRFIDEMRACSVKHLFRQELPATSKRAAAYRAECRWFEQSIPPDLMILIESIGPQDGKSKDASRCYMYWDVDLETRRLSAIGANIDARKGKLQETPLAIVSEHALRRLFQRLNTIDYRAVLRELNPAIDHLFSLAIDLINAKMSPLLVPTPKGVLIFRLATPDEEEAPFVAVTWISDERMRESHFKLSAVQEARAERGVVVALDEGFFIVSHDRLAKGAEIYADGDSRFIEIFSSSKNRSRRNR